MQLTAEVDWNSADFILATCILLVVGISIEIVIRKIQSVNRRRIVIIGILILLILLWVELAVGIFGSPLSGN